MGLDMYLIGKKYVSKYSDENLHTQLSELTKGIGINFTPREITFECAYWRKANQIHKWFVDNVQNGVDNCEQYYVSTDVIAALVDTCKQVLNDHSLANKLLPTSSGFFFGSNEYDEFYFADLSDTIDMLEPLISMGGELSFYYESSW